MYNLDNIIDSLEKIVEKNKIRYNEPMSKHTSMRVGGNADIFIEIDSKEKLKKIIELDEIKNKKIPITVVGNGTNLIVRDNGIRGIVLKYTARNYKIDKENQKSIIINVDAGMLNATFAQILLKESITGFEFAAGIPGTIGGAIVMNAGAFGGEMKTIVDEVCYIDLKNNEIYTIKKDECDFDYRYSAFQDKYTNTIIISSKLRLEIGDCKAIQETMNSYMQRRISTQPLDLPSAGSTFRRGSDFVTAKLIDEAGLKGYQIGGAQISNKHAGFIVNVGNATAKEIIDLIEYTKETVYNKFNKKIEAEVRIIGE